MTSHSLLVSSQIFSVTYSVEASLCHSLQQGKFCYVLKKKAIENTSNGHSAGPSLCERTQAEMHSRGYHSIFIQTRSLAKKPKNQHTWDQQLIQAVWHSLHQTNPTQLARWLAATTELSARERLAAFTSDLLFNEICATPFVVFIEDIDALSVSAAASSTEESVTAKTAIEDILFWIDYCYELRDTYLTYHHLSFAVFGSGPPGQLGPSISNILSHFQSVVEIFQQPDIDSLDRKLDDRDYPDSRPSPPPSHTSYAKEHSGDRSNPSKAITQCQDHRDLGHKGANQPLNGGPTLQQSQYAEKIAKTQILAHRLHYDSSSCSHPVSQRFTDRHSVDRYSIR